MLWANFLHIYQPPDQRKMMMDRVVEEAYRPIISILRDNPNDRITLSIVGCLLLRLDIKKHRDVIDGFRELAARGQIELTAGTIYHPFLPKLPDYEIMRQINLNNDLQQYYFGSAYKPQGFYSPEAGYSYRVAKLAHSLGYKWTIVDEIAFSGKLALRNYHYYHTPGFYSGGLEIRRIVGKVTADAEKQERNAVDYRKLYSIKGLDGFLVHFRERVFSDAMASGQITSADQFIKVLQPEMSDDRYLITGTDGEAYGHHQKHLDHVLGQLYQRKSLETITISQLPDFFPIGQEVEPLASTWGTSEQEIAENNNYARWHHNDNEIHDKQWELTELAIMTVSSANLESFEDRGGVSLTSVSKLGSSVGVNGEARKLLDEALYSCHYWWASARPWWSIELVERGARMLADVVAKAEGFEGGIREVEEKGVIVGNAADALKLYQNIVFTAFDWLRSEKIWDLSHKHE